MLKKKSRRNIWPVIYQRRQRYIGTKHKAQNPLLWRKCQAKPQWRNITYLLECLKLGSLTDNGSQGSTASNINHCEWECRVGVFRTKVRALVAPARCLGLTTFFNMSIRELMMKSREKQFIQRDWKNSWPGRHRGPQNDLKEMITPVFQWTNLG